MESFIATLKSKVGGSFQLTHAEMLLQAKA
jgi:hypothetical protein